MWQLTINGPGYFDTAYDLPEGTTSLGRADENDIVLSGDLVSRRHGRLRVRGGEVTFEDLGSRNGSRVNGEPADGEVILQAGDSVSVGENTLSIRRPSMVDRMRTEIISVMPKPRLGMTGADGPAVLFSRQLKESGLLRALDNVFPFDSGSGPSPIAASGDSGPKKAPSVPYPFLVLLYKTAAQLSRAATLEQFLEDTVERFAQASGATTVALLLRETDDTLRAAALVHKGTLEPDRLPVSASVINTAFSEGAAVAVADVRNDARFAHRESVLHFGGGSVLCVPIGDKAPFRGALYVTLSPERAADLEGLLDLCTALVHLVQTGIDKFSRPGTGIERALRRQLLRSFLPEAAERRLEQLKTDAPLAAWVERQEVTLLITDLAELTGYVGKAEPAVAAELIALFQQRVTSVLLSFDGAVLQSAGPGVVAVFAAQERRKAHAVRAVRSALTVKNDWSRYLAKHPELEALRSRVALSTGEALFSVGPSEAALGDDVYGAPLLEAQVLLAQAKEGQVLITEAVRLKIGSRFELLPQGQRSLTLDAMCDVFDVLSEDSSQTTDPGL
ncbi:MAG: FHA domain-containing protein [Myxococcaceae bacterium]